VTSTETVEVCTVILVGNQSEKGYLEYPALDGSVILYRIFRKWNGGMNWIDLSEDMDRWPAPVVAVIKF